MNAFRGLDIYNHYKSIDIIEKKCYDYKYNALYCVQSKFKYFN